jgi:hypothetical protein
MTEPRSIDTDSLMQDEELDRLLYDACRLRGIFFAVEVRDVEAEEERQTSSQTTLPEDLLDPEKAWQRASQRQGSGRLKPVTDCTIVENLARAARLGTSIPRDIEERMRRDRQRAEAENGF